MNLLVLGDLPPPPPFSLFSGDPPFVAASIAVILFGMAATAVMVWFVARGVRKPSAMSPKTKKD